MIAKAVATEAKMTFFSISASALTSKWIGEGEKMVKALFAVARARAPSFIFIDELDAILSSRGGEEHESSRRLKNEFLIQFDGVNSGDQRLVVMGATNRPFDIDEAARRRLPQRIYVPLPSAQARMALMQNMLKEERHSITDEQMFSLAKEAEGYSGHDLTEVCRDAAMEGLREVQYGGHSLEALQGEQVRPVNVDDMLGALRSIKPSVAPEECKQYEDWDRKFGTKKKIPRKEKMNLE